MKNPPKRVFRVLAETVFSAPTMEKLGKKLLPPCLPANLSTACNYGRRLKLAMHVANFRIPHAN
jgi:hypothetical protein